MNEKRILLELLLTLCLLASQVPSQIYEFGTGADGDFFVAISDTVYIDSVRALVTAPSEQYVLYVSDTAGFSVGDEVLIIQTEGGEAGIFESGIIGGIVPNEIYLTENLDYHFDVGAWLLKIPHFHNVTVDSGGFLMCHAYRNGMGGIIMFRADSVYVRGVICADEKGYEGGEGGTGGDGGAGGAGGDAGLPIAGDGENGGDTLLGGAGGAGGVEEIPGGAGGAGGGAGKAAGNWGNPGDSGYMGEDGGIGGCGGGIIRIHARKIVLDDGGYITANGEIGSQGGAGGHGGRGGDGGAGGAGIYNPSPPPPSVGCGGGGGGGNGGVGGDGGKGAGGGAGGLIWLRACELKVNGDITVTEGVGGLGGTFGLGGLGGLGGAGGVDPWTGAAPGDTGLNGTGDLDGFEGERGGDGEPGVVIYQQVGIGEMKKGWNMVSIPLLVDDYRTTALCPTAISSAFTYEGSYVPKDILAKGIGYWLKFPSDQLVTVAGFPITADTVDVVEKWNMIGSIGESLAVSEITSIPSAIVTSQFLSYDGQYVICDTIVPGRAYWVKVNQNGQLILSSSSLSASSKIRIVPTAELPPPPPDENVSGVSAIPTSYTLQQNYPNPFNSTTTFKYQLPVESKVRLKIYNVFGQEVVTIVDQTQDAGFKQVEWNPSTSSGQGVASGVYFYRLVAQGVEDEENGELGQTFVSVKKMILMK